MNRQSIFFTITISFIISMMLVFVSFGILLSYNDKSSKKELTKRYRPVIEIFFKELRRDGLTPTFLEEMKENMKIEVITKRDKINAVTYNIQTKVLHDRHGDRKEHRKIFRILKLKDDLYVYIAFPNKEEYLLKDLDSSHIDRGVYIIAVFGIIILTLILSFLTTIRKLLPLKRLKEKVQSLGDEEFDFECCNTNARDEVSQLAKEFRESAKKLKKIKEARNVFIRNIMHELKTPITKGRIISELPQTEENSEKLKRVFFRLENIITEFASIEEIISANQKIEKSFYFLTDILDNAIDVLLLDEENVDIECENLKLNVNFRLFNVAVKNLIDNGVKYSNSKKVYIKTDGEKIIFENDGDGLKRDLEEYFEPFVHSSVEGFGLGLYIVNSILKANGYKLEYEYVDGINRFICEKEL